MSSTIGNSRNHEIYLDDLITHLESTGGSSLVNKLTQQDGRKLLKIILLCCLRQLFCELFKDKIQLSDPLMEHYEMDKKIIQLLIHEITESGDYTLQGIGIHTRIPYEVIYAAAYGISNQFSITLWAKLGGLYMEVKPDITLALINKLIEVKEKLLTLLLHA